MAIIPLAPFVRFIIVTAAGVYSNWDTITGLLDRHVEDDTKPIWGYYVQHVFEFKDATGTFSPKERGLCGMHWINTTGGDLDVTWTSADFAMIEAGFETFWTALIPQMTTDVRLVEHRWYAFGPSVVAPNPPARVTTLGTPKPGTATSFTPHQVCSTFTFRTALRRHWGRIYMPVNSGAQLVAGGQWGTPTVDTWVASLSTFVKSGNTNGLIPVVYDRTRKSCLGITAVEVDSIPDVIRRRRPRSYLKRDVVTS